MFNTRVPDVYKCPNCPSFVTDSHLKLMNHITRKGCFKNLTGSNATAIDRDEVMQEADNVVDAEMGDNGTEEETTGKHIYLPVYMFYLKLD